MSTNINFGKKLGISGGTAISLPSSTPSYENEYSFQFDGVDEYIQTDSTYSELDGQSKMTLSMWVKLDNVSSFRIFASVTRDATLNNFVFMLCQVNAGLRFFTDSTGLYTYTNQVLIAGAWTHILVCLDKTQGVTADKCRIFINGQNEVSSNNQGSNPLQISNAPLYIGENQNGKYSPFLGNIDEAAIWSGTDLRSDIATIYNGGIPNNLNDNGLTVPTTWFRMGEEANYAGGAWTLVDQGSGSNNGSSLTLPPSALSTDVPT